ncbi:MAG: hypothetical protein COV79_02955 [Parcubacteria group bacterium CG11_big_fil_rev_8_21_14_0_20_41_14]|nr:MAG: hypothetical protein COV79_02955 [Parcubacteria group bacterium CG11_big_fil_rev_8_21_14_0_20_41_14]PIR57155.1 MAG: hypothetical protein COU72_02400 [Parcubacteria group bacterium CG10_big_fil_rev_8_21_14_0_10_41_35]
MIAVKLDHISKTFALPTQKQDSLRERFINLKFRQNYKKLSALTDINLEVAKGEWLGVIGANGSGKSTLLKIIAGIYEPDQGEVRVKGQLVPFLELGVGFNPDLSARDNIFLNGVILGMSRKTINRKFKSIVDFAGIQPFINQKLKNFSSGMQMRLGFSIAMQTQADTYLLDEVLAVGDYEFQQKAKRVFRSMKQSGKTVIFVSHDLVNVRRWCDRVIWLDHGQIRSSGRPAEVIKQYTA